MISQYFYKFTFFVKILERYVVWKQKVSKSTFKLTSSRTQAACLPDSLRTKDMVKFKFFRKFSHVVEETK